MGKRQKKYWSSFGEINFKLFEKSIWIRDQISCCLDVGEAGAMQGGGWGNDKEGGGVLGDQHGEPPLGMVEDNLGQVGNNLEEAWGNLVEEYFSGDNVPALQVNCPNPKTFKTHLHTEDSPSRYPHHHQPHCQHHPNLWYCVQGHRRRHHPPHQPAQLATGSTTALQTTPINEMLSFYFSKKNYSQSQGSRREREFSSLNLRVRDENEIFFSTSQSSRRERDFFLNISGFETRAGFFLSTSQGSRRERDIFVQSLEVEREKMNLNLTRSREIERSCYALLGAP